VHIHYILSRFLKRVGHPKETLVRVDRHPRARLSIFKQEGIAMVNGKEPG